MPSTTLEAMGLVALEAQARDLPVLYQPVPGVTEALGGTGLATDFADRSPATAIRCRLCAACSARQSSARSAERPCGRERSSEPPVASLPGWSSLSDGHHQRTLARGRMDSRPVGAEDARRCRSDPSAFIPPTARQDSRSRTAGPPPAASLCLPPLPTTTRPRTTIRIATRQDAVAPRGSRSTAVRKNGATRARVSARTPRAARSGTTGIEAGIAPARSRAPVVSSRARSWLRRTTCCISWRTTSSSSGRRVLHTRRDLRQAAGRRPVTLIGSSGYPIERRATAADNRSRWRTTSTTMSSVVRPTAAFP